MSVPMNNKGFAWMPVLLMIAGVGSYAVVAYLVWTKNQHPAYLTDLTKPPVEHVVKNVNAAINTNTSTTQTGITELDDMWNLYTNAELGFSMRIPKDVKTYTVDCPKTCAAVAYDDTRDEHGGYLNGWTFVGATVTSDAELEKFIQDEYGETCSLGKKTSMAQEGVFDVTVQSDGKPLFESSCRINFVMAIRYYPAQQRVVKWDIGQAVTFYDRAKDEPLDIVMRESFRFLDVEISGWKPYINTTEGILFQYPPTWTVGFESGETAEANHYIGLRPESIDEDYWSVVIENRNVWSREQFLDPYPNTQQKVDAIDIAGKTATKKVITQTDNPSYYLVEIAVFGGSKVYEIRNEGTRNPDFDAFLSTISIAP